MPAAANVTMQADPTLKQDAATDGEHHGLDYWVRRLTDREMPAFANTARVVAGEASRGDQSAMELAEVIFQDASMTTRLLRAANSFFHNPGNAQISTVSRAIVLLGFEAVRNMCLSIAIMDSLLDGPNKSNVVKQMAISFHAAVQARTLAARRKDKSPEEVFIAALLYHLGHMAFWCFADKVDPDASQRLQEKMALHPDDPAKAEREVLGFELSQLTEALNNEWHLSGLLDNAIAGRKGNHPRVSNITIGHEIASAAHQGWGSEEMKDLQQRIAESLYLPVDDVTKMLQDNAREAADTMTKLGAAKSGRLIPLPSEHSKSKGIPERPEKPVAKDQFLDPDPDLQLKVLGELSQLLIEEKPNLTLLVEMVLEGVYRGIGLDRTVFALLSPDRHMVSAKHVLGWDRQQLTLAFRFQLSQTPKNILDHVLQTGDAIWHRGKEEGNLARWDTEEVRKLTGDQGFFIAPVTVGHKVIGLFYADRHPSRRPLDVECFSKFKLFAQQAQMGLSYLKR